MNLEQQFHAAARWNKPRLLAGHYSDFSAPSVIYGSLHAYGSSRMA